MQTNAIKGGEFLIRETQAQDIFIREEFTEEQLMMAQACQDFLNTEIYPNVYTIDSDPMLSEGYLEKAGALGLLGVSIPEAYGGLGMNFVTSLLIADIVGSAGSFSTTYGAHTGIGMLPILYYGTEEQKLKYLPKLSAGEWKACYCLTEPTAGSDANSGKTTATLTEDGKHYRINGQKMWITNSGFADVFIVFAKIGADKNLTAFIVEKGFGNITLNPEEHKMGIKGSSTRQVFFNDCLVPVENMLSERENGFKIAVNILNIGRIKLAAGVLGGCKMVTTYAVKYATERQQFGKSIATFGAMKHKLAQMATLIYATESADYRVGNDIEVKIEALKAEGMEDAKAKLKGLEEYAIECALMKVHSSEVLQYVTDEGVQIYGGMGFSADVPMERAYRDARIARIYEGTNEINRLLSVDMLLKRTMKGQIDIIKPAMAVGAELMGPPSFEEIPSGTFGEEKVVLKNWKKAALMIAGKAVQDLMQSLANEQEILMAMADAMMEIYVAESTLLRTEKLIALRGEAACEMQIAMTKIYFAHASEIIEKSGKYAIAAFATGDTQRMLLMGLKRFNKLTPVNTKDLRRKIADYMVDKEQYAF